MSGTISAYQALFLLTERICTEVLKGHRQLWIHFSVFYRLRRPVGRMTVTEQRLEGEFRFVNSRLITNRWGHSLFAVYNRTCDWQTTCIVLSERHCDRCLGAWPSLDAMFSYIGCLTIAWCNVFIHRMVNHSIILKFKWGETNKNYKCKNCSDIDYLIRAEIYLNWSSLCWIGISIILHLSNYIDYFISLS